MHIQNKTVRQGHGEKSKPGRHSVYKARPSRVKRVRPLAPKHVVDIIEHMNDGVVVLDKDWYYVYVNQKAAALLQREKPSDLIGKHIWTEYPEGVGQPFQLAYEKAMKKQIPIVFEEHYAPWDLWFENRVYPSPDRLLILFTDVTERKKMERLLEEHQHLLQKIFDTEPGTVYIYDLDERRSTYANRFWLLGFGYSEEELLATGGGLVTDILHPDDLSLLVKHYEDWRQADEGEIREIEYRLRTKSGEWHWLHNHEAIFARDETGTVKQVLGIMYAITERKLAQEALRRSEQQLELIFDTVSDIIFLLAVEPGERYRFDSVNKAFLRVTGLSNDQVIGRYADEIIPPSSQKTVFANYRRAIQERIPITWEEVFEYPTGKKTAIVTVNPVYNDAGECTHLVGAVHDITERIQVEKALRESEEKFSKVFHSSPIPLSITRMSDGHYIEVNTSFLNRLGYQREEVIGRSAQEIGMWAHAEDREKMMRILRETGSVQNFEIAFRTKSGELGTALLFREIIELMGEEHFIGTSLDITERKQMEDVILKERDFSAAMLNSLPGIFYFYDKTGKFLQWNKNLEVISGYAADEIAQMHPLDFFTDDDKKSVAQRIQNVFEHGESDAEANLRLKNGELIPHYFTGRRIELDGSPYLIGMGIDITPRKRAQAELNALFAAMDDVVLVIDRDGVYRKIAPTNPVLLYKPSEELLGKTLREVFPEEQAASFINAVRQVVDTRQTTHIEYQLTINGRAVWFDASISPMDADSTLWMARDITDRKQAEEKLRQLNEQLEQRVATRTEELAAAMIRAQESDKLKSAFLAAMSHELRTPLNSIIGFTGVILQGLAGPLNEEQSKQLNMTRDSARQLLVLINDLLDISKIEAGQLEIIKRPFDMRQAIESALRVVLPFAQKKALPVVTSLGPGVGIINNDRRRVEQVLINLINNAIKFTEHGEVEIVCRIHEGWLETSVRDDGIGIKQEDMEKLFKPFQQIDTGLARSHEGTGLGLAICKRLVTAMGGEISVESQWSIGSTFKFTLPL